jgi:hypothetical protein
LESKEYYLERAAAMEQLAAEALSPSVAQGFLRAAEAYRALGEAAAKISGRPRE